MVTLVTFDFPGFDRENWPRRDGKIHRRVSVGMCSFSTPSEQEWEESRA